MTRGISQQDQLILLDLARESIRTHLNGEPLPDINLEEYSQVLQEPGACFVTLTIQGKLRGCVGSIEATQPLILEVRARAVGAAFEDYRFPSLTGPELTEVIISISCLTTPQRIQYKSPAELVRSLQPGIDGVILRDNRRRATFLPQVWKKLPEPDLFLGRLCTKMGLDQNAWKTGNLKVEIYQATKFGEEGHK